MVAHVHIIGFNVRGQSAQPELSKYKEPSAENGQGKVRGKVVSMRGTLCTSSPSKYIGRLAENGHVGWASSGNVRVLKKGTLCTVGTLKRK